MNKEIITIIPNSLECDHITLRGKILYYVFREFNQPCHEFILTNKQVDDFTELYNNSKKDVTDILNWFDAEVAEGRLELYYPEDKKLIEKYNKYIDSINAE